MKVLVGIPTYNGAHRVDWLLQSISMRTGKDIDYKIVICDDSGRKDHQEKTLSIVNKWNRYLPIKLLVNEKNIGVPSSWNRIIKSEDSEYIILINDDIIVAKDWLENMVYFLENNNVGAVGYDFLVINEDETTKLLSSPDIFSQIEIGYSNLDVDTYPIRCIVTTGCFFGFNREKYNLVGGFDENYFSFFEDHDFLISLASQGYPNYILRCPKNWHIWGATFATAPEIDTKLAFNRSERYYLKKWNVDRRAVVDSSYMSKIPFQRVKWICKNKIYEDITSNRIYCTIDEIKHFVTEGYRNILKREPDPGGLNLHINLIYSGRLTREEFLNILRNSEEYKARFL